MFTNVDNKVATVTQQVTIQPVTQEDVETTASNTSVDNNGNYTFPVTQCACTFHC